MTDWNDVTVPLKTYLKDMRENDKEALRTALVAAEKRLDLLNELREGVATRDQLDALEKIIDGMKGRLDTSTGLTQGQQLTKGNVITYIGIGISILTVIIIFLHYSPK